MAEPVVVRSDTGGVATLTLNRPDKRNALNGALIQELKDGFRSTAHDPDVRVVVLTGAGKDFCSGLDLAELQKVTEMSAEENLADARSMAELFLQMRRHPRPIVALVRGRALAGGCGLATACDLVLAEEGAKLGYPEVHLGFVPALVMTMLRRKVGEARAFELAARGSQIPADRAAELGLVAHVYPTESFEAETDAYVRELAALPPSALEMTKSLLYELGELGFEEGLERAAQVNAEARMTDACRDGVRRFLERH